MLTLQQIKSRNRPIFCLLALFAGCLLYTTTVDAQHAIEEKKENKTHKRKIEKRHQKDSVWQKDLNITDTASARAISRIQDMNNTLSDFTDVVEQGYDSSDITENLPDYERRIHYYKTNLANLNSNLNLSRLAGMQGRIFDMEDDLKEWQSSLLNYYTELIGMNAQMRSILLDSGIESLPKDTALRQFYLRQLHELKSRLHATDTTTKKNLLKIDQLQGKVSEDYQDALALQKQIKSLVKAYRKKAFTKEGEYLWEGPAPESDTSGHFAEIFRRTIKSNGNILDSYLTNNLDKYIFCLPILILFFLWTYVNIKKVKLSNPAFLSGLLYIQSTPLLAALVITLIVAPYFDLQHPPAIYLLTIQLLLVVVLTLLLVKKWPRALFTFWPLLVIAFVFFAVKMLMSSSTYYIRLFTFFVTLVSVVLGAGFMRRIKKHPEFFPRYFSWITGLYILLNLIAASCNLYGRATLAHIFETTAIANYVEAIGLIIFIQIFLEAVKLQLEADKKSTRFTAYLDYQNVELRLRRLLTVVAGIFWVINLTQNLNIFDMVYDDISDFLDAERFVGTTSFTIGSIVIFFFVIWAANFCQKYIGYFFGESGTDDIIIGKKSKLGTSILLVRLVILTAGFFLGILASGIPLDKVTIIIGALGVGIGLGLQNIVNNLVSGVILAIERPIQVGDIIEISGNTGKVKEIGIRSSRIVTPDGAEIIIPNGDMLSQKLINWTLNNSHLRVEIDIKLADGANLNRAKEIITAIISNSPDIMQNPEPQLLFKNINTSGADLQILFWAFDINKWTLLKSNTLQKIYEACKQEGINVI
jgi:potassium efflux system protein